MNAYASPYFWSTIALSVVAIVLSIKLFFVLRKYNEIKVRDRFSNALEWPYIEEQAEMMVKRCRRYQEKASFMMIDGDNFREIFDNYGPPAGNEALALLGRAVHEVVREVDLFGKYGSGKFIICLSNTDLNGAVIVAERIRQTITEIHPGESPSHYTVSIGCSELHTDEKMEHAIERANKALERAQASGGNRVSSSKNSEAMTRRNSVWPNLKNLK
jgi:diguanylate cyclase